MDSLVCVPSIASAGRADDRGFRETIIWCLQHFYGHKCFSHCSSQCTRRFTIGYGELDLSTSRSSQKVFSKALALRSRVLCWWDASHELGVGVSRLDRSSMENRGARLKPTIRPPCPQSNNAWRYLEVPNHHRWRRRWKFGVACNLPIWNAGETRVYMCMFEMNWIQWIVEVVM